VHYRYKSGSAIKDEMQKMWFDDVPTRNDVIKYIKDHGWRIDTDSLVLYHVQWGHGPGWSKNLLE
jgi:hypothetical protein